MEIHRNLSIYKKLVRKFFLTRYLAVACLPPLKKTRLHYIGNRYIGRRVFPAHRDFNKQPYLSTELSTIHTFFINYPQVIRNFSTIYSQTTYINLKCSSNFFFFNLPNFNLPNLFIPNLQKHLSQIFKNKNNSFHTFLIISIPLVQTFIQPIH